MMDTNNSLLILLFFGFSLSLMAQSERRITRIGNSQYETGNFVDAELNYKKAIEKNSGLIEAQFNLGDALVKQERFEEALESFEIVSNSTEDLGMRANALHNKGNIQLSQQDLEGALESYKDALRLNPKDEETRYNYAYVKDLLDQQKQEEEQNEENQDENKEDQEENQENKDQDKENSENQDQENSKDENKEDKEDQKDQGENEDKEDESDQEQQDKGQTDGEEGEEEKKGDQPKPKENKLSPEEAQRLLEALNQQEEKVQDKLKKQMIKGAKVKIEKDW
jgi:tetratricopeptide (TPR) repeat protein